MPRLPRRAGAIVFALALSISFGVAVSGWTGITTRLTNVSDWAGRITDSARAVPKPVLEAAGAAQQQLATIDTDRDDYRPGDTAIIAGTGWAPYEPVTLQVEHADGTPDGGSGHEAWTVNADGGGNVSSSWYVDPDDSVGSVFQLTAVGGTSGFTASATFTDQSAATLEQCRNGAAATPNNCLALGGNVGWVNGNAGNSNSHYIEGYSIPYRTIMTSLPVGTELQLDLGYDIRNSGKNAIDFLTHYQRLESHAGFGHPAETVNPVSGVSGIGAPTTTFAIPAPNDAGSPAPGQPVTRFNSLPAAERLMTLFGGTITGVSYVSQGSLTANQSETVIRVKFIPSSGTAVLAWGGHVARCADWGTDANGVCNSAAGIDGSPYHMRLKDWACVNAQDCANLPNDTRPGNLGNQDRSLSAAAVFPTGTIIIKKVVTAGDTATNFNFSTVIDTPADGLPPATNYQLVNNQTRTFTDVLANVGSGAATTLAHSAAEGTLPFGFVFDHVTCDDGDSIENDGTRSATIKLSANETVTCTFFNHEDFNVTHGKIIVDKVTDPSGDTTQFTFTPTGWNSGATFPLADATTPKESEFLLPGTYSVAETVPAGWELTSATCSDGSPVTAISVQAGETVTCTFNNRGRGHIVVDKVTNPSGASQVFSFDASGGSYADFTLTDAQTPNDQSLAPGSYSVVEGAVGGWTLTNLVCNDPSGNSTTDVASGTASINLAVGETVTCIFTNTKPDARIRVSPLTATNEVNSPHTITATVEQNSGSGFVPAPDGTTVNFSLLNNAAGAAFVGSVSSCTTTGGTCSVSINTSTPGGVDIRATTTVTVLGVSLTRTTGDGLSGDSADAHKTYVDATIAVTPLTATNAVNQAHLITATVQQNTGSGFVAAPNGTLVTFSLPTNTAGATFVGNVSTCTTTGGTCSVSINTSTPGLVVIHATTTFSVGGVSLTRSTGSGGLNGADGQKTYVDAQIDLTPLTATNNINEPHTITATVQQNPGTGWITAPDGTTVNFSLLNNTAGAVFVGNVSTCTTVGGSCAVQINSSTAGGVDIHATTTFSVGGVSLTRSTGTGGLNSANAHKDYVSGRIIIDKVTYPAGSSQLFTFAPGGYGSQFQLADATAPNNSGQLAPGSYSVVESVQPGWDLTSLTCSDPNNNSSGDVGTRTATISLQAGETVTCTFRNTQRGHIIVDKITYPSGDPQSFNFDASGGAYADFALTDAAAPNDQTLVPGTYGVAETVPTGWDQTGASCSDGSPVNAIVLSAGETVTCTFRNTKRGTITIDKVTNPSGSTQSFNFTPSANLGVPFALTDAASPFFSGLVVPGTYGVAEQGVNGWDLVSATCSDGSPVTAISLQAGENIVCTFVNRQRGKAQVVKTVNGQPPSGTQAFTFQLRQGASTTETGTVLEALVADASNATLNFTTQLVPGNTYQLCEIVMPAWQTSLGTFVPSSFMPPDGVAANPNVDNSIVCGNFTVTPGETKVFTIDNTPPPGGRALTIGFWKNWATCSGGNQKGMLDVALGVASATTTNPPGGLVVSAQNPGSGWPNYAATWSLVLKGNPASTVDNILAAGDCAKAVALLDKRAITSGKKMASDPLFNMTAQLIAAEANRFMSAGISGTTIMNIDRAVLLNGKYGFNGNTYSPKLTAADSSLANCLATQLDNYNNNRPVNSCP
jgi:hypothetical protein